MKPSITLRSLFAVLILPAGVPATFAQPTLGIAPAGKQSVLYWSAAPTNYILQSATNLASSNWVTAQDAVPVNAATVSNTLPTRFFRLIYTNPPAGMALVPAGSFTMGNSIGDSDITDANPTNVYISAFYMDTNLVSYAQWQIYFNVTTEFYGYSFVNAGAGKGQNYPVETVDWFDVVKWCNARSQAGGLTRVYYTDAGLTQVYKTGETPPYVNWAANGYRLPTEAEWEKAARGGLSGRRFPWGNRIDENQANYAGSTAAYSYDLGPNGDNAIGSVGGTDPSTSPVASFDVNGYGLYDITGNVSEWCWDWYGTPYGQPTPTNPTGPAMGSQRVLRGGDWYYGANLARCANRVYDDPLDAGSLGGFRCVKGL